MNFTTKATTSTRHSVLVESDLLPDGETDLSLEWGGEAHTEVVVHPSGREIVVLGASYDQEMRNPFDDMDGEGKIIFHPNARYKCCEGDYFELLGLNRDGDRDFEHSAVIKQAVGEVVKIAATSAATEEGAAAVALLKTVMSSRPENVTDERVMNMIQKAVTDQFEINFGDASVEDMLHAAVSVEFDDEEGWKEKVIAALKTLIDPKDDGFESVFERAWIAARAAGELGDPHAVMLDMYDHSGVSLSVSGEGMQCQWDTSRGAAIWVPDSCALDELLRRAFPYAVGKIEHLALRGPASPAYHASLDDKSAGVSFREWGDAFQWLEAHANRLYPDGVDSLPYDKMRGVGVRRAAEELARGACNLYSMGVYDVSVEHFVLNDSGEFESVQSDICGGVYEDSGEEAVWFEHSKEGLPWNASNPVEEEVFEVLEADPLIEKPETARYLAASPEFLREEACAQLRDKLVDVVRNRFAQELPADNEYLTQLLSQQNMPSERWLREARQDNVVVTQMPEVSVAISGCSARLFGFEREHAAELREKAALEAAKQPPEAKVAAESPQP